MKSSQMLVLTKNGDHDDRASLIRSAYEDLRKLAAGKMAAERLNHSLTSTALVHEISIKILNDVRVPTSNRGQFFAYASKAMRSYLIDHARTRGRQKRGGDRRTLSFEEPMIACEEQRDEFLALNDALDVLAELQPRKAQVVEMRYFGRMSNQETAASLGVSLATVKRDWDVAKAWLLRELRQEDSQCALA